MFHKALAVKFLDGTMLEAKFEDGEIRRYNMMELAKKYPQVNALKDRNLFLSGRLIHGYGIVWTDEIDVGMDTVYYEGEVVK